MAHSENWNRVMDASRHVSQIRSLALAAGTLVSRSHPTDEAAVTTAIDDLLGIIETLAQQADQMLDELEFRVT